MKAVENPEKRWPNHFQVSERDQVTSFLVKQKQAESSQFEAPEIKFNVQSDCLAIQLSLKQHSELHQEIFFNYDFSRWPNSIEGSFDFHLSRRSERTPNV
jgi:hypothetical protein